MTLNFIVSLCADTTFQGQIRAAAMAQALVKMAAASTTHQAADIKSRALALSTVVDGCTANLQRFTWGIACTSGFSAVLTDSTDANDAAIASAMVSQWAAIAGVNAADLGD
jgi:hypothetical protein